MVFGTAWYFYVFSEDAQLQDRSRYSIALFTPGALACLVSLRCCPEGVDDDDDDYYYYDVDDI